jgi:predicted PhzF superfamily epimerase YddE/YHI9
LSLPLPIVQVDAFTDRPFGGNPAAVCLLPAPRDERYQASARGGWLRVRVEGERVILGGQAVNVLRSELV